jgi:hypothetical protein
LLEQYDVLHWGRGVELTIDSTTLALNNKIRIFASLLADVGVRYPGAFAVTAPVTWKESFPAGLASQPER